MAKFSESERRQAAGDLAMLRCEPIRGMSADQLPGFLYRLVHATGDRLDLRVKIDRGEVSITLEESEV